MFKITNRTTTYLAVENANLAPNGFTTVEFMSPSIKSLKDRGAIRVEVVRQEPVVAEVKPVDAVPSTKKLFGKKEKK